MLALSQTRRNWARTGDGDRPLQGPTCSRLLQLPPPRQLFSSLRRDGPSKTKLLSARTMYTATTRTLSVLTAMTTQIAVARMGYIFATSGYGSNIYGRTAERPRNIAPHLRRYIDNGPRNFDVHRACREKCRGPWWPASGRVGIKRATAHIQATSRAQAEGGGP